MREKIARQRLLLPGFAEHRRSKQLADISAVLDAKPEVLDLVQRDLVAGVRADLGRSGLTAEQVLRVLVLQRVTRLSFDELEFAVNDSGTYWTFCRLGVQRRLRRSRIHANIHKVRAETIEAINRIVVKTAIDEKVESLKRTRTDATVTETNIHPPTDSSMLWDTVRVLGRVMTRASTRFALTFVDRRLDAKRAYVAVSISANNEERAPHYRKLVRLAEAVMADAKSVAGELRRSTKHKKRAAKLAKRLEGVVELGVRVAYQTKRRVFEEKKVPSPTKVVSIFEPHTDVIVKDRHDVHYGHKVTLTTGESGLVLDCVVEKGNPADVTLAVRSIKRLKEAYGRAPTQVAFDGSYASRENLGAIKKLGVKDVAFSKGRGLKVAEMVRNPDDYPKLRNFRAAVEGGIAYLKSVVGLDRCVWRGLAGFHSYVWGGVLAANLLTLARHHLR